MKKLSLILMLIMLSGSMVAQYKPIVFGFRGGGGVSWMRSDSEGYSNQGVKPMGSWGFIAQFYLMENYSIMTGFDVNYLGSGLKYPSARKLPGDSLVTFGELERRYKLQYIEIPIVLRMKANISDQWKAYGKIGLGTDFRIRARAEDTFVYEGGQSSSEPDISDDVKLMRYALIVGGGVEYILTGSTALLVDVTFNNGFVDILKDETNIADNSIQHKATISFVELSLGIIF